MLKKCVLMLLGVCNVLAGIEFDYLSLRPVYNAGDYMYIEVHTTNEPDLVGPPVVTLKLYDEFGKTPLVDIFGPAQPAEPLKSKPTQLAEWLIPESIQYPYQVNDHFRLQMTYTYKKKGSQKDATFTKEREILIHGLKAVPGNKPNPNYGRITGSNPYPQNSEESVRILSTPTDNGATWAYTMVKSLLVNQLL
ncbi:hypothetical protein K493DRAFT_318447 [Basidiobolus meristosporus CBS 931.73]|uniref:Macroglobulin domain-containing protein n=1 Tax=Basidiobolus meristosporus CBS 931.73 TaxID=1314790 RepID=A0A1Y1XVL1_9FUNG|nr:hypothetical protein K493DRAFT_318447 [Basidiobolus meristosporus CBS 931.73]|eukprot:ORX89789.1 hypothetical protein K493DRAFT_318447 [Basidiobolus meristosporus CBS 931.73]